MSQDSKSLSDTPMTDEREFDATYADDKGNVVPADFSRELERDNARLREEVEMLNVRHAASMLHAQTHADEYNALREEVNGLLQDIQRLTEEAFEHDKQLAEAKRDTGLAKLVIQQKQDQITSAEAALEQAEARALANEKDAEIGKAVNRAAAELPFGVDLEIALERGAGTVRLYLPDSDAAITDFGGDLTFSAEINAAIDEAIKNA